MFTGYRNDALNADVFAAEGWFKTGDLGSVDAHGLLRVSGRLKDIIIRGGENISAAEIEELLSSHPAIEDIAILGIPDERLGERVCAVVALRDGCELTLSNVLEFLTAQGIAKHKFPERLEVRPALPKTESGKVLKTALRNELR
jgi:non-ribosomal peptide synthetase component E (peptide arylation enzyme)